MVALPPTYTNNCSISVAFSPNQPITCCTNVAFYSSWIITVSINEAFPLDQTISFCKCQNLFFYFGPEEKLLATKFRSQDGHKKIGLICTKEWKKKDAAIKN